jgi:hypothetical protein
MRKTITSLAIALLFCFGLAHAQSSSAAASPCAIVQRALEDYRAIKPGLTRKDVEKMFKYDGGLQSTGQGRFTHKDCTYIKLDVTFQLAPNGAGKSPDDIVKTVSRLYIDYPTMD